jgi:hypothetical protein
MDGFWSACIPNSAVSEMSGEMASLGPDLLSPIPDVSRNSSNPKRPSLAESEFLASCEGSKNDNALVNCLPGQCSSAGIRVCPKMSIKEIWEKDSDLAAMAKYRGL